MHYLSPDLKIRKKSPRQKFSYFQEMGLSGSTMKKILIFQETETLKNYLYFRTQIFKLEKKFPQRKYFILQEKKTSKKFFVFSQEKASLIFQETET